MNAKADNEKQPDKKCTGSLGKGCCCACVGNAALKKCRKNEEGRREASEPGPGEVHILM